MDRSTIVSRLREFEPELKAAGIEHLLLHGSYARGTAIRDFSDVDVVADFDRSQKQTLVRRVHLEDRPSEILGQSRPIGPEDIVDASAIVEDFTSNMDLEMFRSNLTGVIAPLCRCSFNC